MKASAVWYNFSFTPLTLHFGLPFYVSSFIFYLPRKKAGAYVKRTFAIRFRYLLMNAVALRPVSGSF